MPPVGSIAALGSFVALGDSFTEGVGDLYPDGTCRGWADRFAGQLAAVSPGLFLRVATSELPGADRRALERPGLRDPFLANYIEAFRQGSRAAHAAANGPPPDTPTSPARSTPSASRTSRASGTQSASRGR